MHNILLGVVCVWVKKHLCFLFISMVYVYIVNLAIYMLTCALIYCAVMEVKLRKMCGRWDVVASCMFIIISHIVSLPQVYLYTRLRVRLYTCGFYRMSFSYNGRIKNNKKVYLRKTIMVKWKDKRLCLPPDQQQIKTESRKRKKKFIRPLMLICFGVVLQNGTDIVKHSIYVRVFESLCKFSKRPGLVRIHLHYFCFFLAVTCRS